MATICTKNYLRSHRIHRDIADFKTVLFKAREPCPKMQNVIFGPKGRYILHVWASGTCPGSGYSCPILRNFKNRFQKVWKSMCSILQILQVYWLFPAPSRLLDSPTKSYFSINSALSKRAILSRSVCSCAESTVESERKEWSSRSSDTDECTIELQYIVMPHCAIPSSALSNFYPLLRLLAGSFFPFHHLLNNGFNHYIYYLFSPQSLFLWQ